MKKIFAQDKGTFEVTERGDGFLKGTVSVSRLGVFDYFVPDENGVPQLVKKAKLPEDLFSQANQDSVHLAPVTNTHPRDAKGNPILVDKFNAKEFLCGTTSNPRVEGDKLVADEVIYDAKLIEEVEDGTKREVSIGFTFDEEDKEGAYGGEQYSAAQRNLLTNHIAHEEAGRAGPECSFHIDMKEEGIMPKWRTRDEKDIAIDGDNASVIHGELTHYKTAADAAGGKLKTAEEDATKTADKIKQLTADLEEAKKSPAPTGDEKEKVEQLEKDKKSLEDKLELATDEKAKLEKDLDEAKQAEPKMIQDRVSTRVTLEADAKAFGIEDCAGMDDRKVMEQAIQASDLKYEDGVKVGDKPDEAIADRFAAAVDAKRKELNSDLGPDGGRKVEGDVDADIAKNKEARLNMTDSKKGGKE